MLSYLNGQGVPEPFDEGRPVLVQEPDEADGAFLRVPVGEGERARAEELPAQRVVLSLRRLNRLAVKVLQVVLHLAGGVPRRAFERGVEREERVDHALHVAVERGAGGGKSVLHAGGDLGLEQLVQAAFVLRLQRFERKLVPREETRGGRIDEGRRG